MERIIILELIAIPICIVIMFYVLYLLSRKKNN